MLVQWHLHGANEPAIPADPAHPIGAQPLVDNAENFAQKLGKQLPNFWAKFPVLFTSTSVRILDPLRPKKPAKKLCIL